MINMSDEEILREYIHGNREHASKVFVERFKRFVYSVALRYVKNKEDAEDITQDVFIKAHTYIHSFRKDSSLQTWLYRITINVCSTATKKKKRRSDIAVEQQEYTPELVVTDTMPDKSTEDKEFRVFFESCMAKLPEKQRETFILRHVEELSYEEISDMLGTSIGGLKANYFQAVQKLAQIIKPNKVK